MHAWTARIVGQSVGALGLLATGLGIAQAEDYAGPGLDTGAIPASDGGAATMKVPASIEIPANNVWSEVIVLEARPLNGDGPTPGDFNRSDRPGDRDRLPCDLGIDDPARLKVRAEPRQCADGRGRRRGGASAGGGMAG